MVHQGLIAFGIVAFTTALDPHNRGTQIIGSMLLRHTTELPEAGLGEVGLAKPTGLMDLFKDDLTRRARVGAPESDVALKRAQLDRLVTAREAQAEFVEERLDLQSRVTLKKGLDPGPILLKRIRASTRAGLFELRG
jgi:hypothetical protein